jgi:ABC-type antimicrobial peptide transport system ATPase subunit
MLVNQNNSNIKICYIWVEKFLNIGFNISSSDKFQYDHTKNLLCKNYSEPLPTYFFCEQISDVLALIGNNGTGKSNALELVCRILKGQNLLCVQTSNFVGLIEGSDLGLILI